MTVIRNVAKGKGVREMGRRKGVEVAVSKESGEREGGRGTLGIPSRSHPLEMTAVEVVIMAKDTHVAIVMNKKKLDHTQKAILRETALSILEIVGQ